jgi:GTP-binding protein LepA
MLQSRMKFQASAWLMLLGSIFWWPMNQSKLFLELWRRRVEEESEKAVTKLKAVLPRQMFTLKIQAKALGRIIASETMSGMKKDVTQHMYGGDITRKMKLREKQKKGKKKMKERGTVNIPHDVFLKMMRGDE